MPPLAEVDMAGVVLVVAAFFLSTYTFALGASAGVLELPIATTGDTVLDFWPKLNASCEKKFLQDSVCCLGSTFQDPSEAHSLLMQMLRRVRAFRNTEAIGADRLLYDSGNGLQVEARYTCDVPMGAPSQNSGLSCHRCLQEIVDQIISGMSQSNGNCRNAWGLRFGYIFEPESPWEEDTTWCHLDYSFRVSKVPISNPSTTIWRTIQNKLMQFRQILNFAGSQKWNPISVFI